MFESIVASRNQRGNRKRATMIGVSVVAHMVAVAALVARSAWAIEKLPEPRIPVVVRAPWASPPPPPAGGSPAPSAEHREPTRHRVARRIARTTLTPLPETAGDTGAAGTGAGEGDGQPGGSADGSAVGVPGGLGLDIGDAVPVAQPDHRPTIVAPAVLRGLRIAGDEQIQPPDRAVVQMQRSGNDRVVATAKLCLTAAGHVQSVSIVASSGFPAWDAAIRDGIRSWRYRPYRVGDQAIPVCTSVTFVYAP